MTARAAAMPDRDPLEPEPYSIADLRGRMRRLGGEDFGSDIWGDHRWNVGRDGWDEATTTEFLQLERRDAAVLIGVVQRAEGPAIVLTQRTESLRTHSGQVAFPGGRIDPGDDGPVEAALREASEEIGLDRGRAEVIGRLPDYVTGSGFSIAPIVAVLRPPLDLVAEPGEVAAIFEVPLPVLMNLDNHVAASKEWRGRVRHFWRVRHGGYDIWGVTAGIVRMMALRLYG